MMNGEKKEEATEGEKEGGNNERKIWEKRIRRIRKRKRRR